MTYASSSIDTIIDSDSELGDDDCDTVDPVHLNYNFNFYRGNGNLPIMASKAEILTTIQENVVTIIEGSKYYKFVLLLRLLNPNLIFA